MIVLAQRKQKLYNETYTNVSAGIPNIYVTICVPAPLRMI